MNNEELKKGFIDAGFEHWRNDEFHRDEYWNKNAKIEFSEKKSIVANLEAFVDYYTIRIVWWFEPNRKVGKTYYIEKDICKIDSLKSLLSKFAENVSRNLVWI